MDLFVYLEYLDALPDPLSIPVQLEQFRRGSQQPLAANRASTYYGNPFRKDLD